MTILISSCLLGSECRYDGRHSRCEEVAEKARRERYIPVCPEQLGGLPTPRAPSNIMGGDGKDVLSGNARVVNTLGQDVTDAFIKGARETLKLARITGAKKAILKGRSPSCGLKTPYCQTDAGYGIGVTAEMLIAEGIEITEANSDNE